VSVVVYRAEQVCSTGAIGDAEPVSACPVLVPRPEHQRRKQPAVADSERKSRDCNERLVNKRGSTRHRRVSECVGGSAGGGQTPALCRRRRRLSWQRTRRRFRVTSMTSPQKPTHRVLGLMSLALLRAH